MSSGSHRVFRPPAQQANRTFKSSKTPTTGRVQFVNRRDWDRIRNAKLAADPWCERCGPPVLAEHVDHIAPRTSEGENNSDTNLMSLCARCHGRKTASEKAERRKGRL
jgi:5-methylcytosine-specific restriction endonuclease McrA